MGAFSAHARVLIKDVWSNKDASRCFFGWPWPFGHFLWAAARRAPLHPEQCSTFVALCASHYSGSHIRRAAERRLAGCRKDKRASEDVILALVLGNSGWWGCEHSRVLSCATAVCERSLWKQWNGIVVIATEGMSGVPTVTLAPVLKTQLDQRTAIHGTFQRFCLSVFVRPSICPCLYPCQSVWFHWSIC